MPTKVYAKTPKGIFVAQIIVVPLFMIFGFWLFIIADEEVRGGVAIFIVIWEAICIAILANALKLLKRIKNGKIEVAEISGMTGEDENNFASKLRDLDGLKNDKLISEDEYRKKRYEILRKKW